MIKVVKTATFCTFLLLLSYIIVVSNPFQKRSQLVKNSSIKKKGVKYVLYWTQFWKWDFPLGSGSNPYKSCKYKNCFATSNRQLIDVDKFDMIIFYGMIYNETIHGKPEKRSMQQVYAYFNIEAPANMSPDLHPYNSFYNWTMTYRFDSDIVYRYGQYEKANWNPKLPSAPSVRGKKKLVAAMVSHCSTSSKREVLIKEMQNNIPVDIYGDCGDLKCPKDEQSHMSSSNCYKMIEKTYKFYLSFENALCKDYVTEKFYRMAEIDTVPVVYGADTYANSAPPKSYINVADFRNVKELTDYLLYLDQNVDEYLKYFEWKKSYRIVVSDPRCEICKKLNEVNET